MQLLRKYRVVPVTSLLGVCALLFCAQVTAGEASGKSGPADSTASAEVDADSVADIGPDDAETPLVVPPAKGQKEDIIDRVFSPLDDAVTDINRDINKKDDGSQMPEVGQ